MTLDDLNVVRIPLLSDLELRTALEQRGENVGPITSFTRRTLEICLERKLCNNTKKENDTSAANVDVDESFVEKPKQQTLVYYGMYISENYANSHDTLNVYTDKKTCLFNMKNHKEARFKQFNTYDEALQFSVEGPSIHGVSCTPGSDATDSSGIGVISEKSSPYRGPKSQDLVKFRKSIERGDETYFNQCVDSNPRYLVSSGDTPAILQEGSRYNALHISCRTNKPIFCTKVLSIVASPSFFQKLYPDDTIESSCRRSGFLLDLYLNTPDKGFNETPLHFASKYGSVECVRILTSYAACDKIVINKHKQTPNDIISTRTSKPCPKSVEKINAMLGEQFIVPVLRDENNCLPPLVGEPWCCGQDESPKSRTTFSQESPSTITSPLKVRGYAGPMSPQQADLFHKRWRSSVVPSPTRNTRGKQAILRISDHEKGLERVGRDLASNLGVGWNEYWDFLGEFANFSTDEGLDKLEGHLREKYLWAAKEWESVDMDKLSNVLEDIEITQSLCFSDDKSLHPDQGENINNLTPEKQVGSKDVLVTPGSNKSRLSTIGGICRELEALRLNVSLSPMQDSSPIICASRKYLENIYNDNINMTEPKSPLGGSINDTIDNINTVISYTIQSCIVTAKRISEILIDLANSVESHSVNYVVITRTLRMKIKPEVVCLKNVVNRVFTEEITSEVNLGFIHPLIAARALEIIKDNVLSVELAILSETLKFLVTQVNLNDDSSSEEDEPDHFQPKKEIVDETEILTHLNCLIRCLEKGTSLACQTFSANEIEKMSIKSLGNCYCFQCKKSDRILDTRNNTKINGSTTGGRYNKAHSFLHKLLFSEKKESPKQLLDTKQQVVKEIDANLGITIVKKLLFEEDEAGEKEDNEEEEEEMTSIASLLPTRDEIDAADDVDNDTFTTAESSLDDGMVTPEEEIEVYINGPVASKVDVDVLGAINHQSLNEQQFPYIYQWMQLINSHSQQTRDTWQSPCCNRIRRHLLRPPDSEPTLSTANIMRSPKTSTPLPSLRARFKFNNDSSPI